MKGIFILIGLIFFACLAVNNQTTAQEPAPDYTPYYPNYPPLSPQEL